METENKEIRLNGTENKEYSSWGGARPGAGRKKKEEKPVTKKMRRQSTSIRFDPEIYEKLQKLCFKYQKSQSDMINYIIENIKI